MTRRSIEIRVASTGQLIPHELIRFAGGELHVRLSVPILVNCHSLVMRAQLTSAEAILELMLLTDALRRELGWATCLKLVCPYLPYARQDRVCAPGEALSLRVMCDLINGLNFDEVEIWDPHSDVAMALLERAVAVSQEVFVSRLTLGSSWRLVAPDAGAAKKIGPVAKATGLPIIQAMKVRDPMTGAITGTTVDWDETACSAANLLIVDDICDGGRTFIELAKVLRPKTTGRILLFVTHGIFSQGIEVFADLFDGIFTANLFPGVGAHPLLLEV
jgi:ribose-phosphate pyrophosphokinase